MRVFISADMEGCTGIVHGDQLIPGGYDYNRGRELMTGDVVAAAQAALSFESVTQVLYDGSGRKPAIITSISNGAPLVVIARTRRVCRLGLVSTKLMPLDSGIRICRVTSQTASAIPR